MNIQAHWDFSKIPVNQAFTSRLLVKVEATEIGPAPATLERMVVLDHPAHGRGPAAGESHKDPGGKPGPEDIFSTVFDTVVRR